MSTGRRSRHDVVLFDFRRCSNILESSRYISRLLRPLTRLLTTDSHSSRRHTHGTRPAAASGLPSEYKASKSRRVSDRGHHMRQIHPRSRAPIAAATIVGLLAAPATATSTPATTQRLPQERRWLSEVRQRRLERRPAADAAAARPHAPEATAPAAAAQGDAGGRARTRIHGLSHNGALT